DALGTELGIHSNQYGGGASTPIIRGQEGKRIKVLQNNADVLDMSNMSPDHAVTVEPSLAKSIEIIRGASTLLYSSNSAAGVVNVIDYKIPTQMPQDGLEGNTTLRFNTGSNEKLTTAGVTVGLSPHVALRAEGLYRNA
ncbi:TonB-dependent receptor plug domain-containing protein, partial [Mycoplasmoides pneumoniae]